MVAVAAAIIASQAMISGAFAIISQSLALGCFPRVKVVHTSAKYEGQVYIPEVNYMLMIACIIVTATFKTTEKIGHAYGKLNVNIACSFESPFDQGTLHRIDTRSQEMTDDQNKKKCHMTEKIRSPMSFRGVKETSAVRKSS